MNTGRRPAPENDNDLARAAGGVQPFASKYDLGQKVRYLDRYGKEAVGVITEAMFNGTDPGWMYIIDGLTCAEENILGPA